MAIGSTSDVAILGAGVVIAGVYLFREQIFSSKPKEAAPIAKFTDGDENPRDFIQKMKDGVCVREP